MFLKDYSGWSLGFKQAHAADDCPVDECILVPGTKPDIPDGNIDWGDYGVSNDGMGQLSASRENAGVLQSSHYAKNAKKYCLQTAEDRETRCQKKVVGYSVANGLLCVTAGVFFTALAGVACSVVVAGATAYDSLTCKENLTKDKRNCDKLP